MHAHRNVRRHVYRRVYNLVNDTGICIDSCTGMRIDMHGTVCEQLHGCVCRHMCINLHGLLRKDVYRIVVVKTCETMNVLPVPRIKRHADQHMVVACRVVFPLHQTTALNKK